MTVTMDKDSQNGVKGDNLDFAEKDINTNGTGPVNKKQPNIEARK